MRICIEFRDVDTKKYQEIEGYLATCFGKGTRNHFRHGANYELDKVPYIEIENGDIFGNPPQARIIRIVPTDATFDDGDTEQKRIEALKGLIELMRKSKT